MQTRAVLAAIALGLVALPAHAIITRHDVDDSDYRVVDADYPALVDLFEPDDCLGTLIEPSHLLTVAHCATDLEPAAMLNVAGVPHAVERIALHEQWRDGDRFDIAIVQLAELVTHVEPLAFYRGTDEVGNTVTLLGRGTSGTALEGEQGGRNDALLRRSTNIVTAVVGDALEVRMDHPDDPGVTPLEGVGAGGDSGGPVFMDVDGTPTLVGLNAFGDPGTGGGIGKYGSRDYQVRISDYAEWIESAMAGESGVAPESRGCSVMSHATVGWLGSLTWILARRGRGRSDRAQPPKQDEFGYVPPGA